MAKHRAARPPAPKHITRLRLSMLVKQLDFERTQPAGSLEPREWWNRREELLIATGRREPA